MRWRYADRKYNGLHRMKLIRSPEKGRRHRLEPLALILHFDEPARSSLGSTRLDLIGPGKAMGLLQACESVAYQKSGGAT